MAIFIFSAFATGLTAIMCAVTGNYWLAGLSAALFYLIAAIVLI